MSCEQTRLRPQAVYNFEIEYLKSKGWHLAAENSWDIYVWNKPGDNFTEYDHDFALEMQANEELGNHPAPEDT